LTTRRTVSPAARSIEAGECGRLHESTRLQAFRACTTRCLDSEFRARKPSVSRVENMPPAPPIREVQPARQRLIPTARKRATAGRAESRIRQSVKCRWHIAHDAYRAWYSVRSSAMRGQHGNQRGGSVKRLRTSSSKSRPHFPRGEFDRGSNHPGRMICSVKTPPCSSPTCGSPENTMRAWRHSSNFKDGFHTRGHAEPVHNVIFA